VSTKIRPFSDILKDLRDAISWAESRGIIMNASSRIKSYLTHVEAIEQAWRSDGGEALIQTETLNDLVNSLMEGDIMGQVVKEIRKIDCVDNKLLENIDKICAGPRRTEDESDRTSTNRARNLFFELRLGAQFLTARLPVRFDEGADLVTSIDGRTVYIECKRAFTANKLGQLISDARDQLIKNLGRNPLGFGIIALELTRVVPPKEGYVSYSEPNQCHTWSAVQSGDFWSQQEVNIKKRLLRKLDNRILGLIIIFQFPTYRTETRSWGTGFNQEFTGFSHEGKELELFRKLSSCCNAVPESQLSLLIPSARSVAWLSGDRLQQR
jgi:hypothetical protein